MSERTYTVYQHYCTVNGKSYFGITCLKPNARWGVGGWRYRDQYFGQQIEKEGLDWDLDFEHRILAEGLIKKDAGALEKKLIAEHDSRNPEKGYNINAGGQGNVKYTTQEERDAAALATSIKRKQNLQYKLKTDEAYHKRYREVANASRDRRRENDTYREAQNEYNRNRVAKKREADPEWVEQQKQYMREYHQNIKNDPERYSQQRIKASNRQRIARQSSVRNEKDKESTRRMHAKVKELRELLIKLYNNDSKNFTDEDIQIIFGRHKNSSYICNSTKKLNSILQKIKEDSCEA